MKRSPIKRKSPLKSGKPPKKRNASRVRSKFARNFLSRRFVRFVKENGCCQSCGCAASESFRLECSHAEPRGMGGCGAGWWRIFRQCHDCHRNHGAHKQSYAAHMVEAWILSLQSQACTAGVISADELCEARRACGLKRETYAEWALHQKVCA